MKAIIFTVIIIAVLSNFAISADKWDLSREEFEKNLYEGKIDPGEFIKYTEEVLDALDSVDSLSINPDTRKLDFRQALSALDASFKKYERLGPGRWKDAGPQGIRGKIASSMLSFHMYSMTGEMKHLDDARNSASEARESFRIYKEKFGEKR